MSKYVILDDDIVKVYKPGEKRSKSNLVATLFWGDRLKVIRKSGKDRIVEIPRREWDDAKRKYVMRKYEGLLPQKARVRKNPILKVRIVDVGQGDAAIIETPAGRLVLVDGGEEHYLRWYVSQSFAHRMKGGALHCDAILVTHGDADHFSGLTKLMEGWPGRWTPMLTAEWVFHNGLVKGTKSGKKRFGRTKSSGGETYVTDLHDDLRKVSDSKMNEPFRKYKAVLARLKGKGGKGRPKVKRLEYGDDSAFDFLAEEDIWVEVLGPIVDDLNGKPALRFLKKPGSNSLSDSHTINGQSVALRMCYGNVRFLFGADLNEESQNRLLERARDDSLSLVSEILKVPHHGSDDFSPYMLDAISPVVSVISCGDESSMKEHIHPRAGLVGALGKFSREGVDKPLIYATEMVAFFQRLGKADVHRWRSGAKSASSKGKTYPQTYSKKTFGIVHVRTDGSRVLVATHSGKDTRKESYVFHVSESGEVCCDEEPSII